jgi:hippurate hydrolase
MRTTVLALASTALLAATGAATPGLWPTLEPIYRDLHAHPELSFQEAATAANLAARLQGLGFKVTTGVGKTGIVGILENGKGPTLMVRTELDALPVEEKTGLPFASKATGKNSAGETVPVMHACGHDVHMTAWLGTAMTLAGDRGSWHGTLMMVGQPAEEVGGGATAMIDDGLFTRFPRPDFAIAVHDNDALPAGKVGIKGGPLLASADSVDIVVHGRGGHGARPHRTVDPVVIAARIVLSLQTLVSRENDPMDPAVVTVGSIHGGTKHNIIPDDVRLQLTVRAYKPEVRERLFKGIERIAKAEAEAANAPRPPDVTYSDASPVTVNDDSLAARVAPALKKRLGDDRVTVAVPIMGAEDFSEYAKAGVPILDMWISAVNPETLARSQKDGTVLPSLHSSMFAPDAEATIMTGVDTLVTAARELLAPAR